MAATPDGATAVTSNCDRSVRAWNRATQHELAQWIGDFAVWPWHFRSARIQ